MELLKEKDILYKKLILKDELLSYMEENEKKVYYKRNPYNAFALKLKSEEETNILLNNSMKETKMYLSLDIKTDLENYIWKLYKEKRFEDAYYLILQYIINYPQAKLKPFMILALENPNIVIYDSRQEQSQYNYQKASLCLIENKNIETLYLLTKHTEKINPFYSTDISHQFPKFDSKFIIDEKNLSNEEKIYLYMRSILKFGINFNKFIEDLYHDWFTKNNNLVLDIPYVIIFFVYNNHNIKTAFDIDINLDNKKDYTSYTISIQIKGFIKENEKIILDYDILEMSKKSDTNFILKDDKLLNYVHMDQNLPHEKILKAICQSKIDFVLTMNELGNFVVNKYLLFFPNIYNKISSIFYASKILYEQQRHILLKQFLYILISNKMLNDRFLCNKFKQNEYIYTSKVNTSKTISLTDAYILNNIDFNKPLILELKRLLNEVKKEDQLYIYYSICFLDKVYAYDVYLYYDEEVEKILINLITALIENKKDPESFFESLGKNNIFLITEKDLFLKIYCISLGKCLTNATDNISYLISLIKENDFHSSLCLKKNIYETLTKEEQELLNNNYDLKIIC